MATVTFVITDTDEGPNVKIEFEPAYEKSKGATEAQALGMALAGALANEADSVSANGKPL